MDLFKGKTVIVSGGAEGIGFAVAQAVGREGMNVVITDISPDTLATAEATLNEQDIPVLALTADARSEADWDRVANAALERFGAIHALMNNAGVGGGGSSGPIEDHSAEDWRWTIDVNLMGVVFGMKSVVPHIKAAGGGWIVNVASMAGMNGFPYGGAYNATKLAVAGLSEGWSMELAPFGIHVAALCPALCGQESIFLIASDPPIMMTAIESLLFQTTTLIRRQWQQAYPMKLKTGLTLISSRHASSNHLGLKTPIFSRIHRSETAFASVMG